MALYDDCGHCYKQLMDHARDCGHAKRQPNETEPQYTLRLIQRGHEPCARKKSYYVVCPGKCLGCDPNQPTYQSRSRYHELPRRNFIDRLMRRKLKTVPEQNEKLMNLSKEKLEKRERHLKVWREAILAQEKEYMKRYEDHTACRVKERQAAFEAGYAALRAQEERDNVPPEDRVITYDPKEKYSELLSQIDDQNSVKCLSCDGNGEGELKMLTCRHAIHDSCFEKWWNSPLREGLQCPVCGLKFNVRVMPKFCVYELRCETLSHDYVPFLGTDRD